MTDTEGQTASGAEPRASETQPNAAAAHATPAAPRNDAEAAQQDAAQKEAEAKAKEAEAQQQRTPKRNRTGEYIHKLQTRVNELTQALEEARNPKPKDVSDAPTFEQSGFDPAAYADARSKWAATEAVQQFQHQQQQQHAQQQLQEIHEGYNAKVQAFAAEHPDFAQKVNAIAYLPSDAVQLAIMAHENGPDISYAIANDDDLAFQLASIQPHLAAAAVDRIASRLAAAHEAPQSPVTPAPQATARPVSKAPPPVPTVSGKSPTETPPEKLTDAQWWARRNKRAS